METEKFSRILDGLNQVKVNWREQHGDDVALLQEFTFELVSICERSILKGVSRHDIMHLLIESAMQTAMEIDDLSQAKDIVEITHDVKNRAQAASDFITENWPEARSN
mgnify:CR=1 FL=1